MTDPSAQPPAPVEGGRGVTDDDLADMLAPHNAYSSDVAVLASALLRSRRALDEARTALTISEGERKTLRVIRLEQKRAIKMLQDQLLEERGQWSARVAESSAERGRLRAALQEIRSTQGKVCADFEICEHVACASSYRAWAIADQALTQSSTLTPAWSPTVAVVGGSVEQEPAPDRAREAPGDD